MASSWQGDEDEDEAWEEEDDSSETVECSSCGSQIYEDAERCPLCGDYQVVSTGAFAGRPNWWIWVAGGLLLIFILAFVLR